MRIYLTILLLAASLVSHQTLFGQAGSTRVIEGVVFSDNGQPLPYTNVVIKGTTTGTVSNLSGEFRLLIARSNRADSVCFTYIGYETSCFALPDVPERVSLKPQQQYLKELVVTPYDVRELLQRAIDRVGENYAGPHTTTSFYRLVTRKEQQYMHLSEVVMEQWYPGYASERPGKRQIKMVKMRALMDEAASHGIELGMKPRGVLEFDLISNLDSRDLLNKRGFKLHDFELAGEVSIDGRPTYLVTFDQKDKVKVAAYKGEIYIDRETLAFVRIKFGYSPKGLRWAKYGDAATRTMLNMLGIDIAVRRANYDVYYRRQGSAYYLHKVLHNTWLNIKSEREFYNFPVDAKVEYVVTGIDSLKTEAFPRGEAMPNTGIFENQFSEYDSTFWADYNIILPDYEFHEIAEAIERSNAEYDLRAEVASWIHKLPREAAPRIDSVLKFYHNKGRFSGAALIAVGDKIVYENYFGPADKATGENNNANTTFRIGSTAKTFTSIALLRLVDAGLVNLQDPIGRFLPNHPHASSITVHHLLTHTSGIPSYDKNPAHISELLKGSYPIEELVSRFTADSLDFPPGRKFAYSNSGYLLLAAIIEKVTGEDFEDHMNAMLASMALSKTFAEDFATADASLSTSAKGYLYGDPEPTYPLSNTIGAGFMEMSARDLLKWSLALETLLSDSLIEKMHSPHAAYREWDSDYGYGWMIDRYNFYASKRHKIVLHPGTDMGFRSMFVRQLSDEPSEQITIVLLSNHGHFPRFDITALILDQLN